MYFTNNQDSPTMYLRASPATQFPTIKPGGFLKRNYKIVLQKIYLCGEVTSHIHTPIVFSEFQLSIVPYPKYTWPEIVAAPQRSAHFSRTLLHSKRCRLLFCLNYEIGVKIQISVANNR